MNEHTKKAGVAAVVLGSILAGGKALQRPFRSAVHTVPHSSGTLHGLEGAAGHSSGTFRSAESAFGHSSGIPRSAEGALGHSSGWPHGVERAGPYSSEFNGRLPVPASGRTLGQEFDRTGVVPWRAGEEAAGRFPGFPTDAERTAGKAAQGSKDIGKQAAEEKAHIPVPHFHSASHAWSRNQIQDADDRDREKRVKEMEQLAKRQAELRRKNPAPAPAADDAPKP
jgi:hypothetical protein